MAVVVVVVVMCGRMVGMDGVGMQVAMWCVVRRHLLTHGQEQNSLFHRESQAIAYKSYDHP